MARWFVAMIAILVGLEGCSPGRAPFRMVQFCLAGPQEIPAFTSFMDEIAQQSRLEFTDRSGQADDELRSLASDNHNVPLNGRLLNIGADRSGEVSFSACNLGLPANQIVVGFNGKNVSAARQFATAVIEKLSAHWHVHQVPAGQGAKPLADCD